MYMYAYLDGVFSKDIRRSSTELSAAVDQLIVHSHMAIHAES